MTALPPGRLFARVMVTLLPLTATRLKLPVQPLLPPTSVIGLVIGPTGAEARFNV